MCICMLVCLCMCEVVNISTWLYWTQMAEAIIPQSQVSKIFVQKLTVWSMASWVEFFDTIGEQVA